MVASRSEKLVPVEMAVETEFFITVVADSFVFIFFYYFSGIATGDASQAGIADVGRFSGYVHVSKGLVTLVAGYAGGMEPLARDAHSTSLGGKFTLVAERCGTG